MSEGNRFARFAPQAQPPQNRFARFAQSGMHDRLRAAVERGEAGVSPERRAAMERANEAAMGQMEAAGRQSLVQDEPVFATLAAGVQGVPFAGEYFDEAVGLVSGDARDRVRAAQRGMDENRPGLATGARLATGVASSLPAASLALGSRAMQGASLLGTMARTGAAGAALGGVEGAVSGYGAGNDDNRARAAAQRGAIGAGLGGVIGAAAPAAASGVRSLLGRFRRSDVQTIAREFGISDDAARAVRRALDAEDLQAAEAAVQRAGGRAMLADAGRASRDVLDASMTASPRASRIGADAVQTRAAEGGREFTRVLDRFFGRPQGVRTTQAAIRSGTASARATAYDAAYATPIDYAERAGRRLETLWERVPASVRQRAERLMQLGGERSGQVMASIQPDGSVVYSRPADVRQWDYITRALNDMAESGETRGAMGGMTAESRALSGLSREIRDTLRSTVPAYDEALRAGADAIGRTRAVETGASLLRPSMTREQAVEAIRGMTAAERTAARQGLRSEIDDLMARTRQALTDPNMDAREALTAWRALSSRQAQDNIATLMGEGRARGLAREIDRIGTDFELRAAVAQNSRTAIRQAVQGEVRDAAAPGILGTLQEGRPVDAMRRLVQAMSGRTPEAIAAREAGLHEEIVEALTRRLGAQEASRVIRSTRLAIEGQAISEAQAERIARILTAGAAAGAYQTGMQSPATR